MESGFVVRMRDLMSRGDGGEQSWDWEAGSSSGCVKDLKSISRVNYSEFARMTAMRACTVPLGGRSARFPGPDRSRDCR